MDASYGVYSYGVYSYGVYSYGLWTLVMAYIVMAYIVMVYIVMAYIVMAYGRSCDEQKTLVPWNHDEAGDAVLLVCCGPRCHVDYGLRCRVHYRRVTLYYYIILYYIIIIGIIGA